MKKLMMIALAIGLGCMLATPALAVDMSVSGELKVEGFAERDIRMSNLTAHSDSWYQTRLRVVPVFTVNDAVRIHTRFDVHDGRKYGYSDNSKASAVPRTGVAGGWAAGSDVNVGHNIDWDRAWMALDLPNNLGKLEVGRMSGGVFGYEWGESVGERDRIKWTYGYGDWTFLALIEKLAENDSATTLQADQDTDGYAAAAIYKFDGGVAGLLGEYIDSAASTTMETNQWVIIPYFIYSVNDFTFKGEVNWFTGKTKRDAAGTVDVDIDRVDYNIEAAYQMGPMGFELGYAFAQGDANAAGDNKLENSAGMGDDWEKLWILTGSTGQMPGALGGVGNLSDTGGNAGGAGGKLWYFGASYQVLENLNLGAKVGGATADDVLPAVNDSMGTELDLTLSWKFMPAVTYDFVFAWLDAGDFWRTAGGIGVNNFEDSVTVMWNRIKVDF